MKSTSSDPEPYFCSEPWTGVLDITTNGDVKFCPCYLGLRIGNVRESSMSEIWNADVLVALRRAFRIGVLPAPCQGQLCPVALREVESEPSA